MLLSLESLDNNIGNRGVFKAGQFTPGGETPSDDLALYKISPEVKHMLRDMKLKWIQHFLMYLNQEM